jgi:hypothetical protein
MLVEIEGQASTGITESEVIAIFDKNIEILPFHPTKAEQFKKAVICN